MNTTIRDVLLEIIPGDITELDVDAIVNPASTALRMEAGVAEAIKRAGGDGIEQIAVAQGPIGIGEVLPTIGGRLKAQWVLHAAIMGPGAQISADVIAAATRDSLETADRLFIRSIALPAFGTGVGGFPIYSCANIMMNEVQGYLREHTRTGIKHVVFSVYTDVAKAAFNNALAGITRFSA